MRLRFVMIAALAALALSPPGLHAENAYTEKIVLSASASGHDPGGLVTNDFTSAATIHQGIVISTNTGQTLMSSRHATSTTNQGMSTIQAPGHSHLREPGALVAEQRYLNCLNVMMSGLSEKEAAYAAYTAGKVIGLQTLPGVREPNITYVDSGARYNPLC